MAALGFGESEEIAADKCEARMRVWAHNDLRGSVQAEFRVVVGEPSREIVRLADEQDAGLIVMSTHGHTGLKRVLSGSVTERVVRRAPCPVLVIREHGYDFVRSGVGPEPSL